MLLASAKINYYHFSNERSQITSFNGVKQCCAFIVQIDSNVTVLKNISNLTFTMSTCAIKYRSEGQSFELKITQMPI